MAREDNIKIDIDNLTETQFLQWTEQHEKILAEWADKAMCYRWMHSTSEDKYSYLSKIFTIPVIIVSTLTGTANFAIERVPQHYQSYVQIGIGSLNILAGIITTIQQFLKINELNESHRVSAISWGKFYRNIKTELLKTPSERCDVNYLVKSSQEEFDRLVETSPPIDSVIVKKFDLKFKKNNLNISIPEICDSLQPTLDSIFKSPIIPVEKTETDKIVDMIKKKQDLINQEIHIEDFIKKFKTEYSRNPTVVEIFENLEENINKDVINKFVDKNPWLKKRMTKI
jgi:hypothetical protein